MSVRGSIEALGALRGKYQRMLEMRRVHDSGVEHDPREQMRALAAEFPGALREIDELPIALIEERMGALIRVIEHGATHEPWMLWMVDYHGTLRAALRIKRMGLRLQDIDLALTVLRRDYVAAIDEPAIDTLADRETLLAILKPAEGRLNLWVFGRIAERHAVGVEEVRACLFPARRSHR